MPASEASNSSPMVLPPWVSPVTGTGVGGVGPGGGGWTGGSTGGGGGLTSTNTNLGVTVTPPGGIVKLAIRLFASPLTQLTAAETCQPSNR